MASNTMKVHIRYKWWVNPLIKAYQVLARLGFDVDSDSLVRGIKRGTLLNGKPLFNG